MNLPELCYGLLDTELLDPSRTHVTPIIIKRCELGYYRTNWTWNSDYAEEALKACNEKLGVDEETARKMMAFSMFGWPAETEIVTTPRIESIDKPLAIRNRCP